QSIGLEIRSGRTQLLAPYPNPATASVVIPYSAVRCRHARLTVHDVAGREVARVFEGALGPGLGQWTWWAEGERGEGKLAAGVYMIRLVTERGVDTRKVVVAR